MEYELITDNKVEDTYTEITTAPVTRNPDKSDKQTSEGGTQVQGEPTTSTKEQLAKVEAEMQSMGDAPIEPVNSQQEKEINEGDVITGKFQTYKKNKTSEDEVDSDTPSKKTTSKKEKIEVSGTFDVKLKDGKVLYLKDQATEETYKVFEQNFQHENKEYEEAKSKYEADKVAYEQKKKELDQKIKDLKKKIEEEWLESTTEFKTLSADQQLETMVNAGLNNIWMVGPAGCGKTTMGNNLGKKLSREVLIISCGIGTSAAEFLGYKYPTREATKFSQFYSQPSVIVIDEITALDPAVGQVLNAALANGFIETTTGTVYRHPDCIIIATSNTFGSGANRQYVANNPLDASTIDRFVGAVIEVDYSVEFEAQYDEDVVKYVWDLRECIKQNDIRRVASTRMIQSGTKLKTSKLRDWKDLLVINWTKSEKKIFEDFLKEKYKAKTEPTSTFVGAGLLQQMEAATKVKYQWN